MAHTYTDATTLPEVRSKISGPYDMVEIVGTRAYSLKFPPSITRHPVIHVSEIEPASDNPLPGQRHPPPPPVIVDGEEEW